MARRGEQRTRLDPEVRRELILDAAERVLADRVPSSVTFEEIADAAGVSRALVYNYFKDRTGLLVELSMRTIDRLDQELLAALDPASEIRTQVVALGRVYASHARTDAGTWRMLARSGTLDHPSVLARRRVRVERLAAVWGGDDDARAAAAMVTALLEVAVLDPIDEELGPDQMVRFVADVVGPGLARRLTASETLEPS